MLDSRTSSANTSSLHAIVSAIEAEKITPRYIFGAKLASAMKKIAPVDIQVQGGLRKYCEENFPTHIICLGKTLAQGGDNIFYVFDKTYDSIKAGWTLIDKEHSKKAWDFFTNPLINGRLAVSRTNSDIWATLNSAAAIPEGGELVRKPTPESLETLVQAFRAECTSELSTQVELAIASAAQIGNGIGRSWSNTVRLSAHVRLFKEWEQWLLKTQVAGLQVTMPYPSAPILESILIAGSGVHNKSYGDMEPLSRPVIPATKRNSHFIKNSDHSEAPSTSSREDRARRAAIAVIQQLSYEEIRNLKLPFGLVFDALV